MKKAVFLSSLTLVVASTSTSFAEYYPANYWRCTTDQLYGHPSDQSSNPESRTGYGRKTWAYNARTYWAYAKNNPTVANFFWQDWMNQEVADAAAPAYDIDLYPVYMNRNGGNVWVGPGHNHPVGSTYYGGTFTTIKNVPKTLPGKPETPNDTTTTTITVDALCEAGCYTPEQEIRFGDTFAPIAEAYELGQREVTTLAPNATFNALSFIANDIARWTVDIAPADQEILTFRMESGGELRVTMEHPVLTSEGVMKKAADLVIGESLVKEDGSADPIASTERRRVFTKVYNLRPITTDLTSNIMVAQGYLNGSARYQSEYVQYLNRILLRRRIPADLIPRGNVTKARETRSTNAATELH